MKVIAILEQFEHHTPATSPNNMVNYIHYNLIIKPKKEMLAHKTVEKIRGALDFCAIKASGMGGYNLPYFTTELNALKKSFMRDNLVHFFNGDNNCKLYPYLKGRNRVITTYHQPPDFFYNFVTKSSHIKRLDAIIVTSNIQKDLFSKYIDKDRIFFLPLAVDTNIFKPANGGKNENEKKVCLFVGNWLRDFETMREVIRLYRNRKDIEFHIVTLEMNRKYFKGLENIRFYSGISLESYIRELHTAAVMVIPFISCTSNLAILEAMASGLPIITTDVGGIRDYVEEPFALLHRKGDYKAIADSIQYILDNEKGRKEMSLHAREHSYKFSWETISQRLKKIYESLGVSGL